MNCILELENQKAILSRELHDNIGQLLSLTKFHFEKVVKNQDDPDDALQQAWKHLNNVIAAVGSLTLSLAPPRWDESNLVKEITGLIDDINNSGDMPVVVDTENFDESLLPDDMKFNIYRIIQELLSNALKYSKASTVIVSLGFQKDDLHLSVKDDGVGFDGNLRSKGFGFKNIRYRVAEFEGKLLVSTAPGKGCIVEIIFPMG